MLFFLNKSILEQCVDFVRFYVSKPSIKYWTKRNDFAMHDIHIFFLNYDEIKGMYVWNLLYNLFMYLLELWFCFNLVLWIYILSQKVFSFNSCFYCFFIKWARPIYAFIWMFFVFKRLYPPHPCWPVITFTTVKCYFL